MSYLANLAAKTLGVANLARPRLPALFDPQPQSLAASALFASNALAAPGAAEFAADDIVEIVEVERAPAPFSVPRHAARTARVAVRPQPEAVAAPAERESAEAVSARQEAGPDSPGERAGAASVPPVMAPAPIAAQPPAPRRAAPSETAMPPRAPLQPSPSVAQPATQPAARDALATPAPLVEPPSDAALAAIRDGDSPLARTVERHVKDAGATAPRPHAPQPALSPVIVEPSLQTAADAAEKHLLRAGKSADNIAALAREAKSTISAPIVARPQVAPASPTPSHSARRVEPALAPPATPTIQVTIGRIEVRAASPNRPAPARKAPPVMSLEEYLDSRNKGNGGHRVGGAR